MGECDKCYEQACQCPDGRGWRSYPLESLLKIRQAVSSSLAENGGSSGPITSRQQEVLADIFAHSERPDKMTVALNSRTRNVIFVYEDLDDEWFKELANASH